jgi:dihydrofolate reductase
MNLIVAVDENWGIGKGNDLLFHIPEDMKFFRSTTIGKNVVCGKNTLLSFPGGKPLPQRRHFVLTHGMLQKDENLVVIHSVDELMDRISHLPEDEVFVIGGGSVYRQFLHLCKKIYVTKIYASDPDADVFFPNLDEDPSFCLAESGERLISKNGLSYSFCIYEKLK